MGACLCLRPRELEGTTRSRGRFEEESRDVETRRSREAARGGDEFSFGMSASEVISQDNSVSNCYPDLFRVMQVWLSYPNLSRARDMQV